MLMLRPEQIQCRAADGEGALGRVRSTEFYGHDAVARVALGEGGPEILARAAGHALPATGQHVCLIVEGTAIAYPTGGGEVTGTEVGDEESYYEVEVTSSHGSQTDVQLDRGFSVVGERPTTSRAATPAADSEMPQAAPRVLRAMQRRPRGGERSSAWG
jgi:hypothetical protein